MKPIVAALLAGVVTFFAYYAILGGGTAAAAKEDASLPTTRASSSQVETVTALQSEMVEHDGDGGGVKIEEMRVKLQPKQLQQDVDGTLIKHQFLHLHHMKTGGTCTSDFVCSCVCLFDRLIYFWECTEKSHDVPFLFFSCSLLFTSHSHG